jgi:hypothetical protein
MIHRANITAVAALWAMLTGVPAEAGAQSHQTEPETGLVTLHAKPGLDFRAVSLVAPNVRPAVRY